MKLHSFNMGDISAFRTQLMGIATLMIIACHAQASSVLMPGLVSKVLIQGNYGVDIFLFLSGIGMYYSLNKKPIIDITGGGVFLKRRLFRLFVPYEIILLPYCLVLVLLGLYSFMDVFLSLMALEYWFFHRGAWFLSFLIILYFFTPFLYQLFSTRYRWIWAILLCVIVTFLCAIPVGNPSNTNIVSNIQWAFSHTPCFLLGLIVGRDCKGQKSINLIWIVLLALVGIVSLKLFLVGAFLVLPLLIYLFVIILKYTNRWKWVHRLLLLLGSISLESYLTNITLNGILVKIIPERINSPIFFGRYLEYFIVIVVGILMAYWVNQLSTKLQNNFKIERTFI